MGSLNLSARAARIPQDRRRDVHRRLHVRPQIDTADVERYFRALKRAQSDVDLAPERYKHYYLREVPERFHPIIDVRRFGPGERIAFLPYTAEMYEHSQTWMRERGLFATTVQTPMRYERVVKV